MPDRLTVKDLGKPFDGVYEFELVDIISVGRPGSLTNREAHVIKVMSGIRASEIIDEIVHSDNDLMVALAAILISRSGKTVNEDKLWDAKIGCLNWDINMLNVNDEPEEAEADPPVTPAEKPGRLKSGGTSSDPPSGQSPNDQSRTGHRDSETSAAFVQLTSVS